MGEPDWRGDAAGNITWLARGDDSLAFFWHEVAPAARVLLAEALGANLIRLALEAPARLGMTTLLPVPDQLIDMTELAGRLAVLSEGDRPPRVLACGPGFNAAQANAVLAADRIDVLSIAARPGVCNPLPVLRPIADMARLGFGTALFAARHELATAVQGWLLRFEHAVEHRALMAAGRYGAGELCATRGLSRCETEGLFIGRATTSRRCTLLLPGHGGGDTAFRFHVASVPDPGEMRLIVDGQTAELSRDTQGRLVAAARTLAALACHRVDILQSRPGMAIRAVEIERLG